MDNKTDKEKQLDNEYLLNRLRAVDFMIKEFTEQRKRINKKTNELIDEKEKLIKELLNK